MKKGLGFLFFLLVLQISPSLGQILDDTTKQVYSRETTFFFYEKDVLDGSTEQYNPDTTVNEIHRYNWQTRNNNLYQDLGNLGSPLFAAFHRPERNIGVNYGVRIYDHYFDDPDEVQYFNTRSPFTELRYVQGANNFAKLNATFSRNINPYWNTTFKVDRFTSDKNLANVGRDRLIEHWNFVWNTNYRSKNGRYLLLYNYSHLSHEVEEQGGIKPLPDDRIPEDLFLYQSANVWLDNAFTWERRNNHHIYQHFKILRDSTADFRFFHEFDRINIKDRYTDENLTIADTFYTNFYESTSSSFHTVQYTLYENKLGVGGSFGEGFSYRGYGRHRYYYSNLSNQWENELFAGGSIDKTFNISFDTVNVTLESEFQLPGDYRFGFKVQGKKVEAELSRIFYSPYLVHSRFKSNHFVWNNNLRRVLNDHLYAAYKFNFGKQVIKPFMRFQTISDFIYFNELALPEQESQRISILNLGTFTELQWWKLHFDSQIQWSASSGPDIMRFPELFVKAMLYFESSISQGKSTFQIGFDAFYRSAYYGYAYMPATFQYHLQNGFLMDEAIVPDVFASFQFRKAQAFVKVPFFTQGWAVPGYFSSPYYTGVQRPDAVAVGFRWQFYD